MSVDETGAGEAALAAEAAELRARLRDLEDRIHSTLRRNAHDNSAAIQELEKEVRRIVMRLSDIERETVEARIAESM
jgi:vacuolar-type H+-ATPase subunit D/Vma8